MLCTTLIHFALLLSTLPVLLSTLLIRAPSCNFDLLCTATTLIQYPVLFSHSLKVLLSDEQGHFADTLTHSQWNAIRNALNWNAMLTKHRVARIVEIVSLWRIRSARVASLCFWWLMAARSLCGTDYQMPGTPTHRYEIWTEKYKKGSKYKFLWLMKQHSKTGFRQFSDVYCSISGTKSHIS